MRHRIALCTAAALAAGNLSFLSTPSRVFAGDKDSTSCMTCPEPQHAVLPQGITHSDQTDTQGIAKTLAAAVNSVLSTSQMTGLADCLSQPGRQRLAGTPSQNQDLADKIAQFKADWRAKYDQDFDSSWREDMALVDQTGEVEIVQGQVNNPTLLSNWPVNATMTQDEMATSGNPISDNTQEPGGNYAGEPGGPGSPPSPHFIPRLSTLGGGQTALASTNTQEPGGNYDSEPGGPGSPPSPNFIPRSNVIGTMQVASSRTLPQGQDVAIVTFPVTSSTPELTVSLVKETAWDDPVLTASSNWKIDVPDSLTGEKLQANLARQIDQLNASKDQWPVDPNDAHRLVSQHVLLALYDNGGRQPMKMTR